MTNPFGSVSSVEVLARSRRWPLLVWLPVVLVLTPLWAVAAWQRLIATFILGGPVVVCLWAHVVSMLVGRAEAGPDGVHTRTIRGERRLAWDEIEAFEIRRGVYGRVVKVTTTDGEPVELGAPRDDALSPHSEFDEIMAAFRRAAPADVPLRTDLAPSSVGAQRRAGWMVTLVPLVLAVGLAVLFDQPWKSAFWPGRHEASAVPSACDVLRTPSATRLIPSGTPLSEGPTTSTRRSACALRDSRNGRLISVRYDLSTREIAWGGSGSDVAHRAFAAQRELTALIGGTHVRVRGLGDEAQATTRVSGDATTAVDVVARRANVVLSVHYLAAGPPQQVTADAEQVARAALDLVRVG